MLNTPLRRVLFPLLAVVVASIIASGFLLLHRKVAPPPGLAHKVPQVVCKVQDDYELHRALGADGGIYMLLHGGVLSALGPDGGPRWEFATGHTDAAGFAVTRGGEVYIRCHGGHIWALDKQGKLRWERELFTEQERAVIGGKSIPGVLNQNCSDPVLSPSGDVYFLLRYSVVAFTPDGERKFVCDMQESNVPVDAEGKPHPEWGTKQVTEFMDNLIVGFQVGHDGTAYAATDEGGREPGDGLRAVAPDGSMRKLPLAGRAHVDPNNDLILDEAPDNTLTAYDSRWRPRWKREGIMARVIKFDPAGNIYYVTHGGEAGAISPSGAQLWTTPIKCEDLAIGAAGPLYVLSGVESTVTALDRATGKLLWTTTPPEADKEALQNEWGFTLVFLYAGAEGTAYFEGTGNWLYAVGP